jgi:hypothetical protein
MKKTFFETVKEALCRARDEYGSGKALALASGVNAENISRWINGIRSPKVAEISPIMDLMGYRILLHDEIIAESSGSNIVAELKAAKREIEQLREEKATLRGEIRALERQVARLSPTPLQEQLPIPEPAKKAG